MELEKIAKVDLEENAYLKPVSDKGIGFYNLDKNTAQFQFRVTKNDKPLLISDKNVKGYAFFKAMNGSENQRPSISGVLDVDFIDPMRGLIGVTVPGWFLKNVVNSEVLGEVYLSLNDYNNLGKDDTVVLGTFSFTVRDSLVNQIDSDIKVSYIRMFDELRAEIEGKVQEFKQEISDTTDLVSEVNQIVENAKSKVIQIRNESISAIDTAKSDAVNVITSTKDNAIRDIEATKSLVTGDYETINASIQQAISDAKNEFDVKSDNANQTIDSKINQFNETLQTDGFTTKDDIDKKLNELDWQKFKLTTDKGTNKFVDINKDLEKLHSLEPGYYYATSNVISNASSTAGFLQVTFREDAMAKRMIFTPYNSNEIWVKRFYSKWSDWERVNSNVSDTGWIDMQIVNGATPNNQLISSGGFISAYRTITQNGITKKMIRLNVTNIAHGQTIAMLPKDFVKNLIFFNISTPRSKYLGRIALNTSGLVDFSAVGDATTWKDTDYVYGQYEWTE
ncbi:BppU family phage baseplate upper protein [Staphylococcus haemolyticus]|uniref:BppU family phage baseplate upper protein n=1 Tax=Staphylococcus haemolyticus TaxID=1283 RepID=UPI001879BDDA|nr:BppU family phage baseplate upper protein [Staphylococcus haemolyticus]MBE7356732.1 BppU family phage baseplate upper protein [Staphylococcus haemolyticus]